MSNQKCPLMFCRAGRTFTVPNSLALPSSSNHPRFVVRQSLPPLRCTPRFPNCNLYNRDGLQASPPGLLMTTLSVYRQLRIPSFRYKISTTEREEKRHALPKRHQIKHLEFVVS